MALTTEAHPTSFIHDRDSHMIRVLGYTESHKWLGCVLRRLPWPTVRCGTTFFFFPRSFFRNRLLFKLFYWSVSRQTRNTRDKSPGPMRVLTGVEEVGAGGASERIWLTLSRLGGFAEKVGRKGGYGCMRQGGGPACSESGFNALLEDRGCLSRFGSCQLADKEFCNRQPKPCQKHCWMLPCKDCSIKHRLRYSKKSFLQHQQLSSQRFVALQSTDHTTENILKTTTFNFKNLFLHCRASTGHRLASTMA